ncbi:hypothetical protein BpHYR1_009914 [Brachionus plicatilis]|uniref:Uncharacterized protein n=1 Tax=Brachionus plicatilis TaxID=10195 RepID=A0A3M7QDQ5_BRAPC|nr:hypothetical protein BpHYR1_009914 [Brachionus plicatilis]
MRFRLVDRLETEPNFFTKDLSDFFGEIYTTCFCDKFRNWILRNSMNLWSYRNPFVFRYEMV